MIIYKATNQVDGKYYIGQTNYSLAHRKSMHKKRAFSEYERGRNSYFYNAIRKYGFDSFSWAVIAEASSQDELDQLEIRFINETPENMSYNVIPGGRYNPMDQLDLRLRQCERVASVKSAISSTMKQYYGSVDDSARRANLSKAMVGNKNGVKYILTVYDSLTDSELEFESFFSVAEHIGVSTAAVHQHWNRVKVGGGDYMKNRYRVVDVSELETTIIAENKTDIYYFNNLTEAILSLGLSNDKQTRSAIHRAIREQATSRGYKWSEDKR